MVIAIPSFCGLYFMSSPIFNLIFPGHAEGALILKYLSMAIPFIILSQTSTAILQGVGRYMIPVVNLIIACVLKIIITLTLVPMPEFNVYGAIIGTIAGYIAASILNMLLLKKVLKTKISYYDVMIKPAYASIIMTIVVVFMYMYVYNNTMSNTLAILSAMFVGVIIYTLLILLFGIFSYQQIKKKLTRY
jgi:stage V sporulation protein B